MFSKFSIFTFVLELHFVCFLQRGDGASDEAMLQHAKSCDSEQVCIAAMRIQREKRRASPEEIEDAKRRRLEEVIDIDDSDDEVCISRFCTVYKALPLLVKIIYIYSCSSF